MMYLEPSPQPPPPQEQDSLDDDADDEEEEDRRSSEQYTDEEDSTVQPHTPQPLTPRRHTPPYIEVIERPVLQPRPPQRFSMTGLEERRLSPHALRDPAFHIRAAATYWNHPELSAIQQAYGDTPPVAESAQVESLESPAPSAPSSSRWFNLKLCRLCCYRRSSAGRRSHRPRHDYSPHEPQVQIGMPTRMPCSRKVEGNSRLQGLDLKLEVIEGPEKAQLGSHELEGDADPSGASPKDPSLADGTTEEASQQDDCPICLAPLVGDCATTLCGHRFHAACLEQHLQLGDEKARMRCPMCRRSMRAPSPVEASSTSGRYLEVVDVPRGGDRCHFDRNYRFISLGGFASRQSMMYLMTSNEDKRTPVESVMWILETTVPVIVYLNFRSSRHLTTTGVLRWLKAEAWKQSSLQSTVSSGIPNGPYSGPVYCRSFDPGEIKLMGCNCQEGTYFVFIEVLASA